MPSRRAAAIWLGWLAVSGWLASQARLPWQLRVLIILLVLAIAGRTLWSYVCLRGARAVRALEWSAGEQTLYYVCLGPAGRRLPAIPDGCRRYGEAFWLLRFRTAESVVQLLVEPGCQDQRSLRRLARRLFAQPGLRARAVTAAPRRQADTIPTKV